MENSYANYNSRLHNKIQTKKLMLHLIIKKKKKKKEKKEKKKKKKKKKDINRFKSAHFFL